MSYLDYIRAENVLKDFYSKLLDYTTNEIFTMSRKAVSDLEAAPVVKIQIGKDLLEGRMITVADLYDKHLDKVIKDNKEWKVRRESWIFLYSDNTWTGLITGSHNVLISVDNPQEKIAENPQYAFTTSRDIDGVFQVKH